MGFSHELLWESFEESDTPLLSPRSSQTAPMSRLTAGGTPASVLVPFQVSKRFDLYVWGMQREGAMVPGWFPDCSLLGVGSVSGLFGIRKSYCEARRLEV